MGVGTNTIMEDTNNGFDLDIPAVSHFLSAFLCIFLRGSALQTGRKRRSLALK